MAGETVKVLGYREFLKACSRAGKESNKEVKAALKAVAEPVRADAARRFAPINAYSAAGYRVVVRQRGVAVESSRRKTTGLHPEYGALQMRKALLPALAANATAVEHGVEQAIDRIADHFEHKD